MLHIVETGAKLYISRWIILQYSKRLYFQSKNIKKMNGEPGYGDPGVSRGTINCKMYTGN